MLHIIGPRIYTILVFPKVLTVRKITCKRSLRSLLAVGIIIFVISFQFDHDGSKWSVKYAESSFPLGKSYQSGSGDVQGSSGD